MDDTVDEFDHIINEAFDILLSDPNTSAEELTEMLEIPHYMSEELLEEFYQ